MRDLLEEKCLPRPAIVHEAAEAKKGMNFFLEVLVFIAVFLVTTFAKVIIMAPGELVLLMGNEAYVEASLAGDIQAIVAATLEVASSNVYMLLSLFSTVMMIVVTCLFCKLLQKRKLRTIGFVKKGFWKEYLIGAVAGFVVFSVAVLIAALAGGISIEGISPNFSVGYFVLFLLGFLIQGMAEEVLCRGYFMVSLARRYSLIVAIVTNAVVFAALHLLNSGITVLAFVNLVMFGIFASVYFLRRGNIWGIGAFHSIWNWIQGNFYGIKVSGTTVSNSLLTTSLNEDAKLISGGAFGLEGSIVVTIVLLVGTVLLCVMKPRKNEVCV